MIFFNSKSKVFLVFFNIIFLYNIICYLLKIKVIKCFTYKENFSFSKSPIVVTFLISILLSIY